MDGAGAGQTLSLTFPVALEAEGETKAGDMFVFVINPAVDRDMNCPAPSIEGLQPDC